MFKKILLILFLLAAVTGFNYAEKVAELPDVLKPEMMEIDGDNLFITNSAELCISVYSLKDFKLLHKFGKKGEGPGEFKAYIRINVSPDNVFVNTWKKISFYGRDGKHKKDVTLPTDIRAIYRPVGKNFIGESRTRTEAQNTKHINIYDPQLKKVKELLKMDNKRSRAMNPIRMYAPELLVKAGEGRIFICKADTFAIDIFDYDGKKINSVKEEYKTLNVTDEDKKKILKYLEKNDPFWPHFKDNIKFQDNYPAIRDIFADGKNVYVQTMVEKDGKVEFFVYDLDGKFLKKIYLPLIRDDIRAFFPFTIKNGKLYQLVENLDEEIYELHVSAIK